MVMDMKDFIEALKNGNAFNWICNHGHELNKYELIDIVKEYDYAISDNTDSWDAKKIYEAAAEELSNTYLEEE
jgi:hypothetical protein